MIAPADHGSDMPKAVPMPMSATPMVATVVHDEPVMTDTTAQMMHVAARKKVGDMIWTP